MNHFNLDLWLRFESHYMIDKSNWLHLFLTTPKSIDIIKIFVSEYLTAKQNLIWLIYQFVLELSLTMEFRNMIGWEHLVTPYSDHNQLVYIHYQIFPFIKMNQHAKYQANSPITSWEIAN